MMELHRETIRHARGNFSDLPLFASQDWRTMVRRDAPETSIQAAKNAATRRFQIQQRVLRALITHGPMTDEKMVGLSDFEKTPPSSVRSRRAELVRMGLVVRDPGLLAKTRYGGATRVWKVIHAEDAVESKERA